MGGITVPWDGTNSQGLRVSSGVYTVLLKVQNLAGAQTISSTSVTVINAGGIVMADPIVVPNPVPASATSVQIRWTALPGIQVAARLYNVAGELIESSTNDEPDRLTFDFHGRPVSSGVYLVAITATAPWGTVERHMLKLVIIR